ncbi:hypothetical protein MNB_SUP05-SYMBIONT-7-817 [hydrothermal vent metagenome]|uniref:Uncharacterized protein n=1 Tax=hydrothermal vent metagenome TaxID=652676 RepID=A0A1W1E5Z3_9ZZZZ
MRGNGDRLLYHNEIMKKHKHPNPKVETTNTKKIVFPT